MSQELEQRLQFIEESLEMVKMQNRVLSVALKGILSGLPNDLSADIVENIQLAFEDAVGELHYQDHPHADLFHDVTHDFFQEKHR
jgi:hypothetical protein